MFAALISIVALILLLYVVVQRKRILNKLQLFNGPTGWPFIGNALEVIPLDVTIYKLMEWIQIYGRTYKFFLGMHPLLLVAENKLVEFVLSSNTMIEKSIQYRIMDSWLGDGLLISGGKKWRQRRKVFTPGFHYKILEDFIQIFDTKGIKLIENLSKQVGKESTELGEILGLYTLDVICETAMGTSVDAQSNPESKYVKSTKELCKIAFEKCMNPLYQFSLIYKLTGTYRREVNAVKINHGFTKTVIQSRKNILQQKSEMTENDMGIRKKTNFLDILLQSTIDGKPLTDEDILEEVTIFMFEGHDTTSIALSSALYYLSVNPDIQEKVVEELNGIFQDDKEKSPSYNDYQNMKYLEMVIKETLRLCPSVAVHARQITEDTEYNDKVLPAGMTLVIFQYGLHRDPEIFPDPERFDPERFTPENQLNRPPFAYIPFSAGPRNCIGQKFAMLELKSCLSKVLRNFKILPVDGFKPTFVNLITLKTLDGMKVRIVHRA